MAHFAFWVSAEKNKYIVSIFMALLVLSAYFILLFAVKITTDKNSENYLYKFLQMSVITDYKRIHERQIDQLIDSVIECTNSNRRYFLVRNGCIVPCCVMLLEIMAIMIVNTPSTFLLFVSSSMFIIVLTVLVAMIIGVKNNVAQISVYNFSRTLIRCARGIKLYDAYGFAKRKIEEMMTDNIMNISRKYRKTIIVSVLIYVCLSILVAATLLCFQDIFVQVREYEGLFCAGTVLVAVIFASCLCIRGGNKLVDFQKILDNKVIYIDQNNYYDVSQIDEIFITFNDVTLFDRDGVAVIDNLSFSIDDRDFVVVVGEGSIHAKYIYDLIFKNYECNEGVIYIGGVRSTSLPVSTISSAIGYFDEDFCMIFGTVLDNIGMGYDWSGNDIFAAEAACLYEDELSMHVFDVEGNIAINQSIKLKIQIARMMLHKYKAIIVNTPSSYENKENEAIFYNFVKGIMQHKTVILSTSNLNFIMYSNKVLYFGKNSYCFGAHSEILHNCDYMNFLKMSDYNVSMSNEDNIVADSQDSLET